MLHRLSISLVADPPLIDKAFIKSVFDTVDNVVVGEPDLGLISIKLLSLINDIKWLFGVPNVEVTEYWKYWEVDT